MKKELQNIIIEGVDTATKEEQLELFRFLAMNGWSVKDADEE
jgi:hypothetical protein